MSWGTTLGSVIGGRGDQRRQNLSRPRPAIAVGSFHLRSKFIILPYALEVRRPHCNVIIADFLTKFLLLCPFTSYPLFRSPSYIPRLVQSPRSSFVSLGLLVRVLTCLIKGQHSAPYNISGDTCDLQVRTVGQCPKKRKSSKNERVGSPERFYAYGATCCPFERSVITLLPIRHVHSSRLTGATTMSTTTTMMMTSAD